MGNLTKGAACGVGSHPIYSGLHQLVGVVRGRIHDLQPSVQESRNMEYVLTYSNISAMRTAIAT